MKISISDKNTKMGNIPSFSLTPGKACTSTACGTCLKDCYAMKAYRQYPATRNAYDRNLAAVQADHWDVLNQIDKYLEKKSPRFFRIHVAGDFISKEYLQAWSETAKAFPDVKFLAFTKAYHLFQEIEIPSNLQIVFSAWPGVPMPEHNYPIAYMQDGTETRIDGTELECLGNCESCGLCFSLSKTGKNVVFNKH